MLPTSASDVGKYEAGSGGSGVVAVMVASVVVQLRCSVRVGQRVGRGRTKCDGWEWSSGCSADSSPCSNAG